MNVQSHSQLSAPACNGSAERSMQNRLLDVLRSQHPKPVGADRLCALAGVRRILLATAMSELITNDKAHLVCADVYGFGPIAPTARSLGKRLDTANLLVEKSCKRCTMSKAPTEFYSGDSTCKSCRNQLAKDRKSGKSGATTVVPRCKCGEVCQYYGPVGGYSVQCTACNTKQALRRQGAAKQSQHTVPTNPHAEGTQADESKAGPDSALTDSDAVAGKESQPVAVAPQDSTPVETPVMTGEKLSTDVALHIPPRKGLYCYVRGGMVILTQGESSIEIDLELCDAVAGWLMCASDGNTAECSP